MREHTTIESRAGSFSLYQNKREEDGRRGGGGLRIDQPMGPKLEQQQLVVEIESAS